MAQFIFEGRGKGQRTGHERIAMRNIHYAMNWIVGGYYNDVQDGYEEYLPTSIGDMKEEVYESAMSNAYSEGRESYGRAPREMRFAGEKFCREYIDWKFENDGDVKEIAAAIDRRDNK